MSKKRSFLKRILSLALACALVMSLLPMSVFADGEETSASYVLESSELEAFGQGERKDGDTTKVADFFTILWSTKSKVDTSFKTWDDGYASGTKDEPGKRINLGGQATTSLNAVKFETSGEATVKIWWACGDVDRQMVILNAAGETVAQTAVDTVKNNPYLSELTIGEAGTYFIGGGTGNNYIFKIEVTAGIVEKAPRGDWDDVAEPDILDAVAEGDSIKVTVSAEVGYDGADKVTVDMYDADTGAVVDSKNSSAEKDEHVVTFTPAASGTYFFGATIIREAEDGDSLSKGMMAYDPVVEFVLPLTQPYVKSATNVGGGDVSVEWEPVVEAEKYEVSVNGTDIKVETEDLEATVKGLTVGETYTVSVVAVRGDDRSEAGTAEVTVESEAETAWAFSAYGSSTSLSSNGYRGDANDGEVEVYSNGGKGKLVPNSTDGLAFYYTKIDPKTQNFKLSATANVNTWTYSNGQDGFGLMAADRVGPNGDSRSFWNNSYQAVITKVEYNWDGEKVSDTGTKITMKLGVGSQEKTGVTLENIDEANNLIDGSLFNTAMTTLETSCAGMGAGTYNIVGGFAGNEPSGTVENTLTSFDLAIEKNNTGYFVSYTDPSGVTTTKKYYDTEALNHLDEEFVYVGFFASRNADIKFTNVSFTTSDPAADAPAEDQPVTYVTPNYSVLSAKIANKADYTLEFYGNADGTLVVKDGEGTELFNGDVTANEKTYIETVLASGENTFELTMTPDEGYKPSEYELLSSYEPVTFVHTVEFKVSELPVVYVSPDGKASASGTKEDPMAIQAALDIAFPGQTIYLMEGTYNLTEKLLIERGIDGEEENLIKLYADPESESRPVLDFGRNSAGIILAGDWWHLRGFDVTNTRDAEKGIQLSGESNILEDLHTYKNGNTGIQISRYKSTDDWNDWPAWNLILNCTSMLNADRGYEDADGFAAKLTCGPGNVFDGCISAYNADDGWDLYAKVETGSIGQVVIQNSIAYKNGYILDDEGNEIDAGNGNGFKMGGESLEGGHMLENSMAFGNKAKGIDSNSCPDIQVSSCTSFNNGANNVALYTNTAVNTDYYAWGIISYKNNGSTVGENIKLVGNQNPDRIDGEYNYFYDGSKSVNNKGVQVEEDWFVSTDMDAAINGGITRYPDGSINMNGFLERTEKARMLGAGADLTYHEPYNPDEPDEPYEPAQPGADLLTDFVKRLYEAFLGREADNKGLSDWVKVLRAGTATAAKVISGFINSPEYKNNVVNDRDFVTSLYNIIFNREPDAKGLEGWLKVLRNGASRAKVLAGFLNSAEMKRLAEELGVDPGRYEGTDDIDRNVNVTSLAVRIYRQLKKAVDNTPSFSEWILNGVK